MSISATFDQLLRGGRVICPASGIDGIRDVAIRNGKIAAVQPDILPTSARETIDVTGKLVLPGLIDTHAHVYQYVTGRFGMNADMVGVQSGVTTVVDQGGPSCMTLPGFRHFVAEPAKSRVYAFLSAYLVGGLEGHYYPKLYSPSRRCHLSHSDPSSVRCRGLDGLAHSLYRCSVAEIRLPRPIRPPLQKVSQLVHEARAVADALADRPPVARVRMCWVLRAYTAHSIKGG